MAKADDFLVRFWGVRGSVPCPGPATVRYGGNTSCLELRSGPHLLILDAGTGLRELSHALGQGPLEADLFFSHTHIDHICGWPWLEALASPETRLAVWGGHLREGLQGVLERFLKDAVAPVTRETLRAGIAWKAFAAGDTLQPRGGVTVRTAPLNHPGGACGYRVEYGGRAVCYVTDTEHVPGEADASVLALIAGADIAIYDSTYTDEEFPRFVAWGHSTWQEGVRLAEAAGVGTFVAFHHDPDHDDDRMDEIAAALHAARPGSLVAREGMVLRP